MQNPKVAGRTVREEEKVPAVSLVDIFFKARELERKGIDVIHFDVGEPDFDPPDEVVEATVKALRAGKGRYTEAGGTPDARKAVADYLNRKHHANFSPKNVLLTSGGRMALYLAFCALQKDSKVGILSPDWPAYRDLSRFLSFHMRFFVTRVEDGWNPNLDEISKSGCNTLVLNYPNNPTGKVLSQSMFDELVRIANEKGITLIGDEVYSDYIFDEKTHFKSVLQTDRCRSIFTTSFSKSYAMTGFRAGYVVADEETINQLTKINGLILTSVPEFVQHAVIAALDCDAYVREKVRLIRRRRDTAVRYLRKFIDAQFYLPDGSLYLFPRLRFSKGTFDSERFALELLEKARVSVTPGTSFGSWFKEYIRMTLLQDDERIKEGIERMSRALN